jgi:phage gpG-like protein
VAAVQVKVDGQQAHITLENTRAAATDPRPLLNIAGEVMRGSIATTFREEGSPAGSWPRLALSTLRKRGYTAGHKLLILTGRLFNSITYMTAGDALTIGTNVAYARVQQEGSADYRGGFTGPLTQVQHAVYEAERVSVARYTSSRMQKPKYGSDLRTDKNGVTRRVHMRVVGALNRTVYEVMGHKRHQNIPPRPYLVFRPEDPGRIAEGINAYMAGRSGGTAVAI